MSMNEPFETSITIRCTVEHAFRAFTTKVDLWWPRSHRRFENSSFSLDTSVGGRLVETGADGTAMTFGEVVSCDPPNKIQLSWHPGKIKFPTEVTITFVQQGELTTVQVVHSEGMGELGPQWDERVALFSTGWSAILTALTRFVRPDEIPADD